MVDICMGKPIAFIGHKVQCPLCKGAFPIIEGAPVTSFYGKGVALAGMKTACGATLIATQFTDTVELGGKNAAGSGAGRSEEVSEENAGAAPTSRSPNGTQQTPASDPHAATVVNNQDVVPADRSPTTHPARMIQAPVASTGPTPPPVASDAVSSPPAFTFAAEDLAPAVPRPPSDAEQMYDPAIHDAQAATLEKAAALGVPFCSICTAGASNGPVAKAVA